MKATLATIGKFKKSNEIDNEISISESIKIENVYKQCNQLNAQYSGDAICIVLDIDMQPIYISDSNRVINEYTDYKNAYITPRYQQIIDQEDTWQSKALFVVMVECDSDLDRINLKSHLLKELKPEYNQRTYYLQHKNQCDLMRLKLESLDQDYNSHQQYYNNYKIVPKCFPLWKLKILIMNFFGNRTFSGPGHYYWVTAENVCHLKTLHVKGGELIHANVTDTHQYNYFVDEQDAIELLDLIRQFFTIY